MRSHLFFLKKFFFLKKIFLRSYTLSSRARGVPIAMGGHRHDFIVSSA